MSQCKAHSTEDEEEILVENQNGNNGTTIYEHGPTKKVSDYRISEARQNQHDHHVGAQRVTLQDVFRSITELKEEYQRDKKNATQMKTKQEEEEKTKEGEVKHLTK